MGVILAIDQGTTNTKALVIDAEGRCRARASRPVPVTFPQPAWVEQDPEALWESVQGAVADCLAAAGNPQVDAVGISNQRESVLLWERASGMPLGPVVSWQCRRSVPFCDELRRQGLEPVVRERTGLAVDPMFSASKARWLLEQLPNGHKRAKNGELCLGTVDSWLLWKLTAGASHATDMTNASRTQLFNLESQDWDDVLLDLFGIPRPILPEIKYSSAIFGETASIGSLPAGTPVASLVGDSHAALYGHGKLQPGFAKATFGTGTSVMSVTSKMIRSPGRLSTTVAWADVAVHYALEGNILATGAAVDWLREILGLQDVGQLSELARSTSGSHGVYFVPAFGGLGAPYWKDRARGLLTGITRGTTRAHMARAAMEAVCFQVRDVLAAMEEEVGAPFDALLADGGGSGDDLLMQLQADLLGRPVMRNGSKDLSALGAAYLAGLKVGTWASPEEIGALPRTFDTFVPRLAEPERQRLLAGWKAAIDQATHESDAL